MTDRPIIFSAPMVRALLDGRKTQTRRLLKPQPGELDSVFRDGGGFWHVTDSQGAHMSELRLPCAPGDRLYVREAHALLPASAYRMSDGVDQVVNPADRDRACVFRQGFDRSSGGIRWRPSIHMPRWASRLTLTVTDVRVQRLQEISEADAVAEGVDHDQDRSRGRVVGWRDYLDRGGKCASARGSFQSLWNSLHGPDAWDANPWVSAISFTVKRGNIDA